MVSVMGHADRAGKPPATLGQPGHELVGAAAGIGTDKFLPATPIVFEQLGQRELGRGDVIGSGVAAPVAGPQQARDRIAALPWAAVDKPISG